MYKAGLLTIFICLGIISLGQTQDLTTLVFPSEDELAEALMLGEITPSQYQILNELIMLKIDSSSYHLFDEIPNLISLVSGKRDKTTQLEVEQKKGFSDQISEYSTRLKYRYTSRLNENEANHYRVKAQAKLHNHWQASFIIARDNNRERILGRSIQYSNDKNPIRNVVLGSYTARPGLGTIWGFRGRMVSYSAEIDAESLLFPDNGGSNGLMAQGRAGNFSFQYLNSISRDAEYRLASNGIFFSYNHAMISQGLFVVSDNLKNRRTNGMLQADKLACFTKVKFAKGYAAFETFLEDKGGTDWGGFVFEGKFKPNQAELIFAGWVYDDDMADLNAGSKSGNMYCNQHDNKTGYSYSGKRAGQEGVLFKSIVELSKYITMDYACIYSGKKRGYDFFQQLSGISWRCHDRHWLRLDYINKIKREGSITLPEENKKTARLEWRWKRAVFELKSHISCKYDSNGIDYGSYFIYFGTLVGNFGRVELWSDFGRVFFNPVRLDYWYSYIKTEQEIAGNIHMGIKMANKYGKSSGSAATASIELEVLL